MRVNIHACIFWPCELDFRGKSSTKTEQNVVTALMICAFAFIYAKSFNFFMMRIIYSQ